jgi:hypothetical protein
VRIRPTAIPPNLEGAIERKIRGELVVSAHQRMAADGARRHGERSVAKLLAKHRSERADAAKVAVREKLAPSRSRAT